MPEMRGLIMQYSIEAGVSCPNYFLAQHDFMSAFVLAKEGIVINRTDALLGRIPLAAWDLGTFRDSLFLSTQPDPLLNLDEGRISVEIFEDSWRLCKGSQKDQVLVETPTAVVGQVNRRAAAILAPLLEGDIIGTELKLNQEADGRRCKVLYIYALLGVGGNNQVVREPLRISEMRAYIALLACTMKVLNELDDNPDHEVLSSSLQPESEEGPDFPSAIWSKLPGSASWDFATGSIGNMVSKTLINQLGSRTFESLRRSGAELSKTKGL